VREILPVRQKVARARALRVGSTDAECKLWRYLRNRLLGGYRFRRQTPLGKYVADFVCMDAKLVVELDGGQHLERTRKDDLRSAYLARGKFQVIRFWDDDVLLRTDAVLKQILHALMQASPHPNPLPQTGEGE
jgi:very-short-patch-repair endonuclease